ncbi:MAG: hypothetical protein JNJ75_14710 [Cyclobacteriaceae bacterium]|nr:hypothetical protein [Cyclobacteriaceae bacterium]
MRKNSMLQIFMIILFVAGYAMASAQDYVVTIKGDTLQGKVKYFNGTGVRYAGAGSKYIQLIPHEGKKRTFQVLEVISFKMNDDIYHTIKHVDTYTFMKVMQSGYLSLYAYQLENQTTWDGRYFVKRDGSMLEVPNLGFKKRVEQFLADCPDVVKKVEAGDLARSNLKELVDEYNACVHLKTFPKTEKSPAQTAWSNLESAVKNLSDFEKKKDALEMIHEVRTKLGKNETIPSFLISGIKDALKDQSAVQESLNTALANTGGN